MSEVKQNCVPLNDAACCDPASLQSCVLEHALYRGPLVFRAFARCVHDASECIVRVRHKCHVLLRAPCIQSCGEGDACGAASRLASWTKINVTPRVAVVDLAA